MKIAVPVKILTLLFFDLESLILKSAFLVRSFIKLLLEPGQ